MDDYYMETGSHQQYDYEAKQREDKWEYRADEPDHKDEEALYQVEQERNITHALDNAI